MKKPTKKREIFLNSHQSLVNDVIDFGEWYDIYRVINKLLKTQKHRVNGDAIAAIMSALSVAVDGLDPEECNEDNLASAPYIAAYYAGWFSAIDMRNESEKKRARSQEHTADQLNRTSSLARPKKQFATPLKRC